MAEQDGMIQGNFYTNYTDFSTISNKRVFKGRFQSNLRGLIYEGYFSKGLPHFYGAFFINKIKVYEGYVYNGVPHGEGSLYCKKNGKLLFSGWVDKGFPYRGTVYQMPKVYQGVFKVGNRQGFKFQFRRVNLMAKSLDYGKMLKRFQMQGVLYYGSKGVEYIEGLLYSELPIHIGVGNEEELEKKNKLKNGVFKLKNESGSSYYGSLVNSKRIGFGVVEKENKVKILGFWSADNTFFGLLKFPNSYIKQYNKSTQNVMSQAL